MGKLSAIVLAIGLAVVMSMPVLGIMTVPRAQKASMSVEREDLHIELLAPLQGKTQWYGGAVIPVKVMLTDPDDNVVTGANVTLWVNGTAATSPGKSFVGNTFLDLGGGMYQYNINTKPYPAGPGSPDFVMEITAKAPEDRTVDLSVSLHLN